MNSLENKIAVVTGGGTGMGRSVAESLAHCGAQVVIGGRRESVLAEVVSQWHGTPPIRCHPLDVTSRESVHTFFDWVRAELGPVDILVSSAGTNIRQRTMARMQPEEWDHVMAINATGVYNCMHAVLPAMRERHSGLIVVISSVAGKRAVAIGGVAYNASKFAATALGTSVGQEDAAYGIRVTNVFPGEVNTPMLDVRPEPPGDAHRAAILQPEDVGQVVTMIATLPPHVHIPELIIKPVQQDYA